MANAKISALTSATTPVAGTETLPIVQSSATVKLAISDITPGLSTITAAKGGTGQTSYAIGDLLYASTTTALSKLADVATGNALISGGVSTAPSWGKIGLTTHISGTLPVANGGTGLTSFTASQVLYGSFSQSANLTFDGTTLTAAGFAGPLNGTVGATTPAAGTFTSVTDSGNLTFTGTGNRITGDFSNGTITNRVSIQNSTANAITNVHVLPNGTATTAAITLESHSAATTGSFGQLIVLGVSDVRIISGIRGAGTYLPMTFYTNGGERVRIDTSGNVGIGATANASAILDAQSTTKGVRMPNMTTVQKNAISSPAAGLMVFDTTLSKLCVYSGATWETVTSI
jgi:hypothetical protein